MESIGGKMKFDLSGTINDMQGNPLKVPKGEGSEPLLVKFVIVEALLHVQPPSQMEPKEPLTCTKSLERYMLAQDIYKSNGSIDLDTDQISEIKALVRERWRDVLISGQVYKLLEGA
jgi:hypothetical protein